MCTNPLARDLPLELGEGLKLTVNEEKTRILQSAGRRVRLPGIHVRANVFGEDYRTLRDEAGSAFSRARWSDAFWSWNVEKFNWRERHRPLATSEA